MSNPTDLPLSPPDVDQIIAALEGSAFETMELATPRFVLKIARSGEYPGGWSQEWRHTVGPAELVAVAFAPEKAAAPAIAEDLVPVFPPLPGAFYRSPQPGANPFVSTGDVIAADTVIGIIETMKVMNSVPAGVAGQIVEILVQDGQMVDQDFAVMHVRPAAA